MLDGEWEDFGPQVSLHAQQRWDERFPDLNITEEFSQAQRVGRKRAKKIRQLCPATNHRVGRTKDLWYLITKRTGVVFVYAWQVNTIVTVFPYPGSTQ